MRHASALTDAEWDVIEASMPSPKGLGGSQGFDGGKKIKGRERHRPADTGGPPVAAQVHAANIPDRDGAPGVSASIGRRVEDRRLRSRPA